MATDLISRKNAFLRAIKENVWQTVDHVNAGHWTVDSSRGDDVYIVTRQDGVGLTCNCQAGGYGSYCKHVASVELWELINGPR
jgi:glucose-6-phosphate-specific signal transduction histidine kinase